ncbi:NAD(P)-binding protein [Lizonia empirigonia]|nr:NAD(P)-binding protein [Lizonia empirigonia]
MSYSRIGAGIGLAIVRQLAFQYPKSPLNNGSFLIYLTARDKGRGEAALKQLEQDAQLKQAKALKADGGLAEIKYHHLDMIDSCSIESLADYLKEAHTEGIDFVINNAGIALTGFDPNIVKETLHTNYHTTLVTCPTLLPVLNPPTASSTRENAAGFPSAAYATSKAGCIGGTKVLARKETLSASEKLVNACCPGYTPDRGALTPVLLRFRILGGRRGVLEG